MDHQCHHISQRTKPDNEIPIPPSSGILLGSYSHVLIRVLQICIGQCFGISTQNHSYIYLLHSYVLRFGAYSRVSIVSTFSPSSVTGSLTHILCHAIWVRHSSPLWDSKFSCATCFSGDSWRSKPKLEKCLYCCTHSRTSEIIKRKACLV